MRVQPGSLYILQLRYKLVNIQRHAVADDAGGVVVAHAGGHQVECKAPMLVNDGVSRICAALKANNNIALGSKHIRDLALTFIAPVCSYNSLYHMCLLL